MAASHQRLHVCNDLRDASHIGEAHGLVRADDTQGNEKQQLDQAEASLTQDQRSGDLSSPSRQPALSVEPVALS